jgi:NADH-quinone oxidoreductase subunit G
MIASELALSLDIDAPFVDLASIDEVTAAIAAGVPGFAGITAEALAGSRDGIVAEPQPAPLPSVSVDAPKRNNFDYRLAMSRKLYDRAIGTAMSPSLAKLTPGAAAHVHPLDLDQIGAADGADVKLVGSRSSVVLPITADPMIQRGVVWVPFNQGGGNVENIVEADAAVNDVRIEIV